MNGKRMSQKEDKRRIYNSREWHRLRDEKRRANPTCERCKALGQAEGRRIGNEALTRRGWVTPVQVIHHIVPIETARNYDEMRALAFRWDNLQSLCFKCHSEIHQQMNSRSKDGHKRASEAAFERWKERQQRGQSGACISSAEREDPRTECKAKQQRQQPPTDGDAEGKPRGLV